MKILSVRPIALILFALALFSTGCSSLESKAKTFVSSFQKEYADPNDACTFLTGKDISIATGDNILSKQKFARGTSSITYDCSYNLSSTSNGYQQGNLEVHVIPTDTYDTFQDKSEYMMTSTETSGSSNGSVSGFSGHHAAAYWNQSENTLYEERKGYAISVKVPFTHSGLDTQDACKNLAKTIFDNLPSQ